MSDMKVQTFKASPAMVELIEDLVKRKNISKSKVIRMAIARLWMDTDEGNGIS